VDADGLTSVDLLEEIRTALDGLEPALLGRTIDIEMPRLRVLADPMLFRRMFADLIGCAVAHSEPPDSITVHVARTGKEARIEVVNESGHVAGDGRRDRNRRAGWRRDLLDDLAPGARGLERRRHLTR
jgi:signal transduction histidine kinase